MAWDLLERVRRLDASEIGLAFLDRARAARKRFPEVPLLPVEHAFDRDGSLQDVFLLGLLTRAFSDEGAAYLPDWAHDLTPDTWRAKGASRRHLEEGLVALLERIETDRTSLSRDERPLGFPLGHFQLESDHSVPLMSSAFLTVRTLEDEFLVVEHAAYEYDRPPQRAILGVVARSDAGRDLLILLAETGVEKEYLGAVPRRATVVDQGLPAGTFLPLQEKRRRRGHS